MNYHVQLICYYSHLVICNLKGARNQSLPDSHTSMFRVKCGFQIPPYISKESRDLSPSLSPNRPNDIDATATFLQFLTEVTHLHALHQSLHYLPYRAVCPVI